ncbi:MAG: hypothetical protein ACXADX_16030 [Candidatus Hodarchaeales archaeon]|jgi:hypothetical protein
MLFLLIAIALSPQLVQAEELALSPQLTSKVNSVRIALPVKIIFADAYYTELDGDGFEDDVVTELQCEMKELIPVFYIYIDVELPSGTTHGIWLPINPDCTEFKLRVEFHDIATEPGWYTARVFAAIPWDNDSLVFYLCDTIEFDPPGKGGSDPG